MRKQKVTAEYIALTLLLFVLQAMWPSSMNAQVVGATLSGVVADSSGAAVPAAKISIRNVGTDDLREVSSNADGLYSAPNLLPGTYEVGVSAQGFSTVVQKGINLSVGAQQALNFTLKPGQVSQSVEVTDIIPA